MTDEAPTPDKPLEKLIFFFRDPARPLWQRIAAPLGVLFLLWLPFACGEQRGGIRTPDEVAVFSSEKSGLGDAGTRGERLLARIQEEPAAEFDIEDLGLDDASDGREEEQVLNEQEREEELDDRADAEARIETRETESPHTPFRSFPRHVTAPWALSEGADGSVYVADKFALLEFPVNEEEKPQVLLNQDIYDSEFNAEMPSMSTLHAAADGSVWLGFFRGQVLRYHRFTWSMLTDELDPIEGRVFAIEDFQDSTFFAGKGLWRWDDTYKRAISSEGMQRRRFRSLLESRDGQLYAAGGGGVWRYIPESREWTLLWSSSRTDGVLTSIIERADGRILVGTRNGIVELSKRGIVTDRLLAAEFITDILEDSSGQLFASTRTRGLFFSNGESWFRAGTEQGLPSRIDDMHLDRAGRLWFAASRDGLFRVDKKVAAAWLKRFPEQGAESTFKEPKIFASACDAAGGVLEGIALSGGVAVETLDGVSRIFFNNQQVCPQGLAYRRPDGVVLSLQGWTLTLYREKDRELIEIPKEYAADRGTALLLDSRNRIWFGTSDSGLYLYENGKWQNLGSELNLINNRVREIFEDSTGKIWVASNPTFDRASRRFLGDPLTLFNGEAWSSFGPANNLRSWAVNDILELSEQRMFFATMNGFSILYPNGQIINFSKREKLDPVYSFSASADGNGFVWLAHQFFGDGISWFDGSRIFSVSTKEGLFSERIVRISHDRHGRVWLSSATGQVAVYPRDWLEQRARTLTLPERKQLQL